MWIGLKRKNITDGLEGRPLISTENRGTRKIPQVIKQHCHLKKMATIVYIYNTCQLSLLLVTTEFQLSSERKKRYKCNRWFYVICISWACKSSSVFFKIFLSTSHSKISSSVVLDVALCYFNVPVKSKLNDPSWAFELLAGY